MLHPVFSDRPSAPYCGPVAIAAVTGVPVADVEAAVLAYRAAGGVCRERHRGAGQGEVRSMWWDEVEPVLTCLGWRAHTRLLWRRPTFAQWLCSDAEDRDGPCIVLLTEHFVAVCGAQFVDSFHCTPVPIDRAKRWRRRRVYGGSSALNLAGNSYTTYHPA
jgi:hypothetical protein